MTMKKDRIRRAKQIRKTIGVDFILSQKLAKTDYSGAFLDLLRHNGYDIQMNVTSQCPDDFCDIGFYTVSKDGVKKGDIPFDCTGILI